MITVGFVNFWGDFFQTQYAWFHAYLQTHLNDSIVLVHNPMYHPVDVLFATVFGPVENIDRCNARVKIFFTGENLEREEFKDYQTIDKHVDLIAGFSETDLSRKLVRFPLWLIYYPFHSVRDKENNLLTYLSKRNMENRKLEKKNRAILIASHDIWGGRGILKNAVEGFIPVDCAGAWNTNVQRVGSSIEDKIECIKHYQYSICPENTSYPGYHTEKIFHALEGGCIPIYWASDLPEKGLLNESAYCFVRISPTKEADQTCIQDAIDNPEKYQPESIFTDNAHVYLQRLYDTLGLEIMKRLQSHKLNKND